MNSTVGMKILDEQLEERQFYMRRLRGPDVFASVKLGAKLFKTARWGSKYRPDLIIENWVKFFDDSGGMLPGATAPLQLPPSSPAVTPAAPPPPAPKPTAASPASFTTTTSPKAPPPPSKPATPPKPPPAPRPAATGSEGLSFLKPVEKPSTGEELNDTIPF
jgi:hypothetical protein